MRRGVHPHDLLGAVLAGGMSTRYGFPKALAPLAGRPMSAWGLDALRPHFSHLGLLTGDPEVGQALELPTRGDQTPGQGPLGGLVSALLWARELGLDGVFLLACDLPLIDRHMVQRILAAGFRGEEALVPASPGPLGMEPLCAGYSMACLDPALDLLASGRRSMKLLLREVGCTLVPLETLGGAREAAIRFRNVNTRQEARVVEKILMKRGSPPILCIVGKKNAGKTSLTVALAGELNRRGYRVMTVKSGHGFQVDQTGKDSWRHRHEGGAIRSVLAGPRDFAVVGHWPEERMSLDEIVRRFLYDADIVLAEGAKGSPQPRVEVFRKGVHQTPLLEAPEPGAGPTLALVTDDPHLDVPVPSFFLDDANHVRALADFLEQELLHQEGVE